MIDMERKALLGAAIVQNKDVVGKNKEEKAFISRLRRMDRIDMMNLVDKYEGKVREKISNDIFEGFDLDKLLAGEDPWPSREN